jgi:DNA-binding MarR family transcriptional regulator
MDPLKVLEKQSGFLRLLVYLSDKKEKALTEILDETDIPVHQLYSSIEKAKDLDLVKTRMDSEKYPPRNLVSLTAKGKKFSEKLQELMKILEKY